MSLKQRIEENIALVLGGALVSGAVAGWAAHIAVQQQSNLESVAKGTYILKSDLEASGYIPKAALQAVQKELDLQKKRAARDDPPFVAARDFTWNSTSEGCKLRAYQVAARFGMKPSNSKAAVVHSAENRAVFFCNMQSKSERIVLVAGPDNEKVSELARQFATEMSQ